MYAFLLSLSISESQASVAASYAAHLPTINENASKVNHDGEFTHECIEKLLIAINGKTADEIEQLLKDDISHTVLATTLLNALGIEGVPGANKFAVAAGKKTAASRDHPKLAELVTKHFLKPATPEDPDVEVSKPSLDDDTKNRLAMVLAYERSLRLLIDSTEDQDEKQNAINDALEAEKTIIEIVLQLAADINVTN